MKSNLSLSHGEDGRRFPTGGDRFIRRREQRVSRDNGKRSRCSDFPAATASKTIFAAMQKNGWHEVRLLGLADVLGDQDDAPQDAIEQAAAKKLVAGQAPDDKVVAKSGKRYLRVATGIPVVSEKCIMCHENFKGNKGERWALFY